MLFPMSLLSKYRPINLHDFAMVLACYLELITNLEFDGEKATSTHLVKKNLYPHRETHCWTEFSESWTRSAENSA